MSLLFRPAGRRRAALRLEPLESRTVPATAAVGLNFAGGFMNDGNTFVGAPPDTDGAIGPNHYVQFINGEFAVYTKATGVRVLAESDFSFWNNAGLGSLASLGLSDTRVIYDPLSGRWFASEISVNNGSNGNSILVGRSDTNDPTGIWKGASYVLNANEFADYPTLGVDGNAVYLGINDFPNSGAPFESITSIPKSDLLLATPTVANRSTRTDNPNSNTLGFTPLGVTNFNTGQTTSTHGSILAADLNDVSGRYHRTTVTGTSAAGATFGTSTQLSGQAASDPSPSRQPDGTANIDGDDWRIPSMVYQVGDLIFAVRGLTVNSSGVASTSGSDAVRIIVIRDSTSQIVAQATYFNSAFDYTYPSLAVNAQGDMVIGFTRSSNTQGSGTTNGNLGSYAVFAHIDPNNLANGITFIQELQLRAGLVNNYHPGFIQGGVERWGDFSATSVDPNNPTAFWTTQEYARSAGTWGTQISQVWVSPRVTGVSSPQADGTYGIGTVIPITVTYNDAVDVTGTPQLTLNSGGTASYVSGSGTNTLTFNYTVGAGQSAADLDEASATALTLNGGTIKDHASGIVADLTLAATGAAGSLGKSNNIAIDTTAPTVTNVSSPTANGTYGVGITVDVTVQFNRAVVVDTTGGTPTLTLNTLPGRTATYLSGSGSTTLTFRYTTQPGDTTKSLHLDASSTSSLALNGATIMGQVTGAAAVLTLPTPGAAGSLGANKTIIIDAAVAKPANVTSPDPNGTYGFNDTLMIQVVFTLPVVVDTSGGNPTLALNSGGTAVYSDGSGTNTLDFTYTVQAFDTSPDLNYVAGGSLVVPSGSSVTDQASGLPAGLTLPAPAGAGSLGANKNLVIDALPAKVTNVTTTSPNGTYQFGAVVTINVGFTKPVVVDTTGGNPTLALNSGGTATYADGSGTNSLTFSYTVGLGDFSPDLDYTSTGALIVPAGSGINDQAIGIAAGLTLPTPGTTGSLEATATLAIDGRPAAPTNVTSSLPDGTYGLGTVIPITVTFSKSVDVTGTPLLALNTGEAAVYTGGDGTFTTLTFSYTVQAADTAADLDYASATALTLNGGSIQDHASNTPAPLTLPAPGTAGSLGFNKNIVVDTAGPTVVAFRVGFGTGQWFDLLSSARFDVPWKVTAIQVVFNKPVTTGNIHSLTGLTARQLTGLGTTTLTWRLSSAVAIGTFATSLESSGPNALKNATGSPIAPFSHAVNVLWGDVNGDRKVDALDEAGVRAAQAGPYQPGSSGYNIFADLSGDGIVNLLDVTIARQRKGTSI